ncbi:MAG: Uma2 family endonuclease [Snowella sp.]|nr:Uma2 family endonuclease [Snowella sp.]
MIANQDHFRPLTSEDYFRWEETQAEKHEYIDGEVYAMSGGSVNHGRLAIRLTAMLDAHVGDRGCITGNSDIKINIAGTNNYTYPDASVTCDERDKKQTRYFTYPCLIIEVISASTEAYDRGGKFRLYRQNPVLQDYLLVSSTSIEMDLYHKNHLGEWLIFNYQQGDIIELKSINLNFPIEQIYQGLILATES